MWEKENVVKERLKANNYLQRGFAGVFCEAVASNKISNSMDCYRRMGTAGFSRSRFSYSGNHCFI